MSAFVRKDREDYPGFTRDWLEKKKETMISNLRKRSTNISPEGFEYWTLSANESFGSRNTINRKKTQQIRIHCKWIFASISGSTKITQDDSDNENEKKKTKGKQVIEKSNLDTVDMTQTQTHKKKKKIIRKRRTRSSKNMEK